MLVRVVPHGSREYQATLELRRRVMRTPLGLDFTTADLESDIQDMHLAAFADQQLVGCLVLTSLGPDEVQMRQVCVEPAWQNKGIGSELVGSAEVIAAEKGFARMVLHARLPAVAFYLAHGYTAVGEVFEEVTIPHQAMVKQIDAHVQGTLA